MKASTAARRVALAIAIFAVCWVIGENAIAWRLRQRDSTTREAMRRIVTAMESLRSAQPASLPHSLEELEKRAGVPIPRVDGWEEPIELTVEGAHYTVVSRGSPGKPDLIAADGRAVTWPEDVMSCP